MHGVSDGSVQIETTDQKFYLIESLGQPVLTLKCKAFGRGAAFNGMTRGVMVSTSAFLACHQC